MYGIIYKVTNLVNYKVYIGQTVQKLQKRWATHCSTKSGCLALHNAIQKYGKENFIIQQIDVGDDRVHLNELEQYWIEIYNSVFPNGYNLTEGGDSPVFSETSRLKMSKSQTGKVMSIECRQKMSAERFGKSLSYTKKVYCVELDKIYDSIANAERDLGMKGHRNISACCKGTRKTAGGYHWRYIS